MSILPYESKLQKTKALYEYAAIIKILIALISNTAGNCAAIWNILHDFSRPHEI